MLFTPVSNREAGGDDDEYSPASSVGNISRDSSVIGNISRDSSVGNISRKTLFTYGPAVDDCLTPTVDLYASSRLVGISQQTAFQRVMSSSALIHKQAADDARARGAIEEALKEWDAAVQLLRQVPDLDADSYCLLAACLSDASQACFNRGDFPEAVHLATEALAVDPKNELCQRLVRETLSQWGLEVTASPRVKKSSSNEKFE